VIFDFARRRLYLQPGSRFSEPDREDRSGLHLLREGVTTFIYSVDEGSPAHESGARPRDTIESLNGRAAREMTMKAIRELLQSESAETVIVEIRRDRQVLELSILLNG
jgi:C-terminal processing protease CtpA/Prc